jgi:hypothetical protein
MARSTNLVTLVPTVACYSTASTHPLAPSPIQILRRRSTGFVSAHEVRGMAAATARDHVAIALTASDESISLHLADFLAADRVLARRS